MKLPRRKFLHLAAGAAALPVLSRFARAQAYPTKPVRIVVGVPPGGTLDIMARLAAQWLTERLGQQFVGPQAGGVIADEVTDHQFLRTGLGADQLELLADPPR